MESGIPLNTAGSRLCIDQDDVRMCLVPCALSGKATPFRLVSGFDGAFSDKMNTHQNIDGYGRTRVITRKSRSAAGDYDSESDLESDDVISLYCVGWSNLVA